jgi:hypothetical protein
MTCSFSFTDIFSSGSVGILFPPFGI